MATGIWVKICGCKIGTLYLPYVWWIDHSPSIRKFVLRGHHKKDGFVNVLFIIFSKFCICCIGKLLSFSIYLCWSSLLSSVISNSHNSSSVTPFTFNMFLYHKCNVLCPVLSSHFSRLGLMQVLFKMKYN